MMQANQLMTAAAVAFAGFAAWYVLGRKPGGQVAAQPAQQQRDAALQNWLGQQAGQAAEFAGGWLKTDYGVTGDLSKFSFLNGLTKP